MINRPLYESPDDLRNEQDVAQALGRIWYCHFVKLPLRYHVDFAILRDKELSAWSELKVRNYSMSQIHRMGGYMLSLGKWSEARRLYDNSKLPFVLVVKTTDGLWYHTTEDFEHDGVAIMGRTDRNDWQDVEPCVILQTNRFKQVS